MIVDGRDEDGRREEEKKREMHECRARRWLTMERRERARGRSRKIAAVGRDPNGCPDKTRCRTRVYFDVCRSRYRGYKDDTITLILDIYVEEESGSCGGG